jgi:hypothetical protein
VRRRGVGVVVSALVLALGGACKKKQGTEPATPPEDAKPSEPEPAPAPAPAATLTIHVSAQADANAGRPLYVVVRAATLKDFVEDQYREVAALVIEPDETVLASFLVFPGTEQQLTIAKPEGKTVGVYCLLTLATGTSWKRLFEEPEAIDVVVGRDRLLTKDVQ